MSFFNKKFAEIYHDPALNAVVVKWKDFASPEEYQETIENAYELALEKKCPNWISDMTTGKAVSVSSVNWLQNIWLPKMAREGVVRKIAFLIDYNPDRKIFVDTIKEIILLNGISFKSFRIKSDMENWIKGHSNQQGNQKSKASSFSQYY